MASNVEENLWESKEECAKSLEDWEIFKSKKLKERDNIMLDFYEVELTE